MPDFHQLLIFLAAGLLLNLTPGPDVMFIVAHAVRSGVRAGVVAALGITAGCCVHVAAAALGVSALLMASRTAFTLLKWLGALYLIWVGVQMLGAAWRPASPLALAETAGQTRSQAGLATRAQTRVAGMSAADYIHQSIVEPNAYVVEPFAEGLMYQNYGTDLTEQEINDLVAYTLTLE